MEHCADNFLHLPMGLSLFLPRLRDSKVLPRWCYPSASSAQCLAAYTNAHSPKLTALEMRDGSSTFLIVHGRTLKWRTRDRPCGRLGSPVRCATYSMYRSSVGVQFALSATQPALPPASAMESPIPSMWSSSFRQVRHTSTRAQQIMPGTSSERTFVL